MFKKLKAKIEGMSEKTKKTLKAVGLGIGGVATTLLGGFVGYKLAEAGMCPTDLSDGEGEYDEDTEEKTVVE